MVRAVAAVVLALACLVAGAHLGPVRRAVLRTSVRAVERRGDLVVRATGLDYNLLRLRFRVTGLQVASTPAADRPFVAATSVEFTVHPHVGAPWVTLGEVRVAGGRVSIERTAGGTNLPSGASGSGDPGPLRIDRLALQSEVAFVDRVQDVELRLPAVALAIERGDGTVRLAEPGMLRVGMSRASVDQLSGGIGFDGRDLQLQRVLLRSSLGRLQADGRVGVLAAEPSMALQVAVQTDAASIAPWLPGARRAEGTITADMTLRGATTAPAAAFRVQSPRVQITGTEVTGLEARGSADTQALTVDALQAHAWGGRIDASGRWSFASAGHQIALTARDLDATVIATVAAGPLPVAPTGRVTLVATGAGNSTDITQWTWRGRLTVRDGANAPGRLVWPGTTELQSVAGEWRANGRHVLGGVVPLRWALAGQARSDGPLSGRLDVEPAAIADVVGVARTVGLVEPSFASAFGTVTAMVAVSGTTAKPVLTGSADVSDLDGWQLRMRDGHVDVRVTPADGRGEVTLGVPRLLWQQEAATDLTARLVFSRREIVLTEARARQAGAAGQVAAAGSWNTRSSTVDARATVMDWQLVPTSDRPAGGTVTATLTARGSLDAPVGQAEVTVADAAWQGAQLGDVVVRGDADGQDVRVEASARALGLTGTGSLALQGGRAVSFDVGGSDLDLARLAALVPSDLLPVSVTGRAALTAHAEGPLASWRDGRVTVTVAGADGMVNTVPFVVTAPTSVQVSREALSLAPTTLRLGGVTFTGSGTLPVEGAQTPSGIQVSTEGDLGSFVALASAFGGPLPVSDANGPVAGEFSVGGSLRVPKVSGDVRIGAAHVAIEGVPALDDLQALVHVDPDALALPVFSARVDEAAFTASGSLPLAWVTEPTVRPGGPTATATVRVRHVTPGLLGRLTTGQTPTDVAGSLDATLALEATGPSLGAVLGELRIDRLDATLADLPLTQQETTRVHIEDGIARIDAWDWRGSGVTLAVAGQVRLADLDATLRAGGAVDLRVLTPFLRDAGVTTSGRLVPAIAVDGSLRSPLVTGTMTLEDGEIELASPNVLISDLTAAATLSDAGADVPLVTGSVNGGGLTGRGRLRVDRAGWSGVLVAELDGVPVEFPEGFRSQVGGTLGLEVAGQPDGGRPGRLSGNLRVSQGEFRQNLTLVGGLFAALQSRRDVGGEATGAADAITLDIALATDDDVVVDNNLAALTVGADLRVLGTVGTPLLAGRAEVRDGGRVFLGRNIYDVLSATLDFSNPQTIDPAVTAVLQTRVGNTAIQVDVSGTVSAPAVALSAPDGGTTATADLASLLVTGRPLSALSGNDAALVTGAAVIGNLSGDALGLASRVLGLDAVRLGDVASTRREGLDDLATSVDPTSRLSFSKAIGTRVEATLSQSLRNGSAQTWVIDYSPSRRVLARLVSDDEDLRRYEFRHDVSIGGPVMAGGRAPSRARRIEKVAAVIVEGDLGGDDPKSAISVHVGDALTFSAEQQLRSRVEAYYRSRGRALARVTLRRETTDRGVQVRVRISAGPKSRLVLTGDVLAPPVAAAVLDTWRGGVVERVWLAEIREVVQQDLRARGYFRGSVSARVEDIGGDRVVTVSTSQGPQTTHVSLDIDGVDEAVATDLRRTLADTGLVNAAVFDAPRVRAAVAAALRRSGFSRPDVTVESPRFEADAAAVRLTIRSGPVERIGQVLLVGATSVASDTLQAASGLSAEMPFDAGRLETARDRVRALLQQQGFPLATVDVATRVSSTTAATDVVLTIHEGPRRTVSRVVVDGQARSRSGVVTEAIALRPGDALPAQALLDARTRLFATGLFRRADVLAESDEARPATATEVPTTVRVIVEEWPALRVRYGGLLAEEWSDAIGGSRTVKPGLSADVTRRTVLGRAITIGAVTELQSRVSLGRAFVTLPTLKVLPLRSSLILQQARQEFGVGKVSTTTGVAWEQRGRLWGRLDLSYAYRFDRAHSVVASEAGTGLPDFDIALHVARLTVNAAWDTRDDAATPTRGLLLTGSLEDAPAVLGSQIRFVRGFAQARYFRRVGGPLLASAAQVGVVSPLGGQEVIPSERFYTGGSTSIRGLTTDGAGTRDLFGPVGGRALLLFNEELRVPVSRALQVVGFLDAGNVFDAPGAVSLSRLTTAVGGGIRLVLPYGLVRVDYGRLIHDAPSGERGRWVVSLGHAF